ncbi:MAG: hypothetical protein K2K43_02850 [Alistipes sp.]|nr:hypothetical protein [Alistipes sp.]
MKKWLVFLLGFIAGILFTFIAAFIINSGTNMGNNGITFFEHPGECLSISNFEVMQVVGNDCALAHEVEWDSFLQRYKTKDLLVLIMNDNGEYYYDEQIIKVPKGKCMRQVGIYKYQAKSGIEKTVPIVMLMNK